MDWSNEKILEFLQVFASEPAIWNPKHEHYKRKMYANDAWERIQRNVSWECTVEELKKKKDSLMAYYRQHLHKLRKTSLSDPAEELVISWFAFDAMHSFLKDVYDCPNTEHGKTEEIKGIKCRITHDDSNSNESEPNEYTTTFVDVAPTSQVKRPRDGERTTKKRSTLYECELYGQLLTQKLMKLDEENRLVLMNKIDNLVFNTTMRAKHKEPPLLGRVCLSRPGETQPLYHNMTSPGHEIEIKEEVIHAEMPSPSYEKC